MTEPRSKTAVGRSRTFRSGNSQAVRLPRELAFDDDVELTVVRSGDVVTMYPVRPPLAEMFARLKQLPKPSYIEQRESDIFPERDGL
jgi:antitoxin VapB